jgi:hypothetical protein
MKRPPEMTDRLKDGDTDQKFCREILAYIEALESKLTKQIGYKEDYKAAFMSTHDRMTAAENQVKAADALASWARAISDRKASPVTGGRLILERDIVGLETTLAAYRAAKEAPDLWPLAYAK